MRQLEEFPIDPEIAAQLEAIDATLAGEAVDPQYAELAELALLVTADRPQISSEFAASLDERVGRRFAPAPESGGAGARTRSRFSWPRIGTWPAAGGFAAAAAAAVAVVIVVSNGSSSPPPIAREGVTATSASSSAIKAPAQAPAPARAVAADSSAADSSASASSASASSAPAAPQPSGSVQPIPNGHKIVQSSQLELTTAPNRIDDVSQELFNVIGAENGSVSRSTVTSTGHADGYATFQLSVPSGNLADTMKRLSSLQYAHVASRTDSSQDVNDQYVNDVRRLADARALRTSLLKQLANASTQTEIDSLTARIHDAEASINSDEATLRGLQHRVGFSNVSVTINAGAVPVPVNHSGGGGFTLRKAAHDAGRVLTVAAGVALITLAALVPIALIVALGAWISSTVRRRRREHALDVA